MKNMQRFALALLILAEPSVALAQSDAAGRARFANEVKNDILSSAQEGVKTLEERVQTLDHIAKALIQGEEISFSNAKQLSDISGQSVDQIKTLPLSSLVNSVMERARFANDEASLVRGAILEASNSSPSLALTQLSSAINKTAVFVTSPNPSAGFANGSALHLTNIGTQIAILNGSGGPTANVYNVAWIILVRQNHAVGTCTGTLVRPEKLLTAAHCFCPLMSGSTSEDQRSCLAQLHANQAYDTYYAYFQHGGIQRLRSMNIDPDLYLADGISKGDLALASLASPLEIDPADVSAGPLQPNPTAGIVEGFGYSFSGTQLTGNPNFPVGQVLAPGIMLWAPVKVSSCPPGFDASICWKSSTTIGGSGGTCDGDSGGPLIVGNDKALAGVTSLGGIVSCSVPNPTIDTDVSKEYKNFLSNALGPPDHGGSPPIDIYNLPVGFLDANGAWSDPIEADSDLAKVVIGVNVTTDESIRLLVSPAQGAAKLCDIQGGYSVGLGSVGSCVIPSVKKGEEILVKLVGPSNTLFQLAVTGYR